MSNYNKDKKSNSYPRKNNNANYNRKKHDKEKQPHDTYLKKTIVTPFSLDETKDNYTLCSYVVLNNFEIDTVIKSIGIIIAEVNHIVVSLSHKHYDAITTAINESFQKTEKISFNTYNNDYDLSIHNNVFKKEKSDIFLTTNSSVMPRTYAIQILKRYLYRDQNVISIPSIYDISTSQKKYSLRFPTLFSKILQIFGSKKEQIKSTMMERGEGSYYKIHKIPASKSSVLCINSKVFKDVGGFPKVCDTFISSLKFFKKIHKYGNTLFVPTARFIETSQRSEKVSIIRRFFYFIVNVF